MINAMFSSRHSSCFKVVSSVQSAVMSLILISSFDIFSYPYHTVIFNAILTSGTPLRNHWFGFVQILEVDSLGEYPGNRFGFCQTLYFRHFCVYLFR